MNASISSTVLRMLEERSIGFSSVMTISFSMRMPMPSSSMYRPGSTVMTMPGRSVLQDGVVTSWQSSPRLWLTLLNAIDPRLALSTGDISQKLGRGRHTTRHVELFELPQGGYVADTPGFSAVDLEKFQVILKDELAGCFREMRPYEGKCRFTGCSHTKEKGCAVLEAVQEGKIAPSRHQSYVALYEQAKNIKEWEIGRETR